MTQRTSQPPGRSTLRGVAKVQPEPYSRQQQKFEFAQAADGVPWAIKKLRTSPTMRVRAKGAPTPHPLKKYDAAKKAVIAQGRKKVRARG